MKFSFWMHWVLNTAVSLVEAFVAGNTHLTDQQKADLEAFIEAGQKVLNDFK